MEKCKDCGWLRMNCNCYEKSHPSFRPCNRFPRSIMRSPEEPACGEFKNYRGGLQKDEAKDHLNYQVIYSELYNRVSELNKILDKACDAGVEVDISFVDCTNLGDRIRRSMFSLLSTKVLVPLGVPPSIKHSDKIPGVKG